MSLPLLMSFHLVERTTLFLSRLDPSRNQLWINLENLRRIWCNAGNVNLCQPLQRSLEEDRKFKPCDLEKTSQRLGRGWRCLNYFEIAKCVFEKDVRKTSRKGGMFLDVFNLAEHGQIPAWKPRLWELLLVKCCVNTVGQNPVAFE